MPTVRVPSAAGRISFHFFHYLKQKQKRGETEKFTLRLAADCTLYVCVCVRANVCVSECVRHFVNMLTSVRDRICNGDDRIDRRRHL